MDSKCLVDYRFKQRTDFDKKLLKELYKNKLKKKMIDLTVSILPDSIVRALSRGKAYLKSHE